MKNEQHSASVGDAIKANEEEQELDALVDVLGTDLAQKMVRRHMLAGLVKAEQVGYWNA